MANWTEEEKRKIWDKGEMIIISEERTNVALLLNGTAMGIGVHRLIADGRLII